MKNDLWFQKWQEKLGTTAVYVFAEGMYVLDKSSPSNRGDVKTKNW